jgi:ubiquitin C-terminal hydrolase
MFANGYNFLVFMFQLRCCSCGFASDRSDPIADLSLGLENVDALSSALEYFTRVENLDGKFKCDSCKEEVSKDQQYMFDQTPTIAAFHLKRFKSDGIFYEKIDKYISFPLELDLQPYTILNENNDVSFESISSLTFPL